MFDLVLLDAKISWTRRWWKWRWLLLPK